VRNEGGQQRGLSQVLRGYIGEKRGKKKEKKETIKNMWWWGVNRETFETRYSRKFLVECRSQLCKCGKSE